MRYLVFDRTCTKHPVDLSRFWSAGARLYRSMSRIDAARGAATWEEALDWLLAQDQIQEIQFWGHGKWGAAFFDRHALDAAALSRSHPLHTRLEALRERLTPDALVWFRSCETLGARAGMDFAERLSDFLGARVAGHTYVIGFHQSGLHGVLPGTRADWSPSEGLAEGTPEAPVRARFSLPFAPNTITCFAGRVPEKWFAQAGSSSG
jgi:hypothetical protein